MNWTLETDTGSISLTDAQDLRRRLLELQAQLAQTPTMVMLNAPDGSCLTMGLGRELCFLNFISSGGWPAQHVVYSHGSNELLKYLCRGELTEVPMGNAVPFAQALDAALEFFKSNRPTGKLEWEDD